MSSMSLAVSGIETDWAEEALFNIGILEFKSNSFLVLGYGIAGLLLVVYFAIEDSPIHRSRSTENNYLFCIFCWVQIINKIFVVQRWDYPDWTVHRKAVINVESLMRIMCFSYIVMQNFRFRYHAPYREMAFTFQKQLSKQTDMKTLRMVYDLEALCAEATQSSFLDVAFRFIGDQMLVPVLYICFIISDFAAVSDKLAHFLAWFKWLDLLANLYVLSRLIGKNIGRRLVHDRLDELVAACVESLSKESLEFVLSSVSVGSLMEVAAWRTVKRLTRCDHDTMLTTMSKIILLDALQKRGLGSKLVLMEAKEIILKCFGMELTMLKNAIDEGGDYFNLYKLVYNDIYDKSVRKEILRHFKEQALAVRKDEKGAVGIKVLSDIDDTLYSSGGKFPAGCDTRFPKHVVYPGCLSLFRILDRSSSGNGEMPSCNLVFLSARPHIFKDYSEDHSYRLFAKLFSKGQMHVMPTLLPGALWQGIQALATYPYLGAYAWKPVGKQKSSTYFRFRDLYYEYDYIFFGDNGQGDLYAAGHMVHGGCYREMYTASRQAMPPHRRTHLDRRMAARTSADAGAPELLAVLIHEVMDERKCLSVDKNILLGDFRERGELWREELREQGIHLHRSYVGAALAFHRLEPSLLSAEQLLDMVTKVVEEFDHMRLVHSEWDNWEAALEDLMPDLEEANKVLEEAGLQPTRLPRKHAQLLQQTGGELTQARSSDRPVTGFIQSLRTKVDAIGSIARQSRTTSQDEGLSTPRSSSINSGTATRQSKDEPHVELQQRSSSSGTSRGDPLLDSHAGGRA